MILIISVFKGFQDSQIIKTALIIGYLKHKKSIIAPTRPHVVRVSATMLYKY